MSAPSGSKVENNSWQDINNDRGPPASASSPGGWADIREHSAFSPRHDRGSYFSSEVNENGGNNRSFRSLLLAAPVKRS
jgi:hypothetical protein